MTAPGGPIQRPKYVVLLESMQDCYNDLLIQTGKAITTASKDGRGNISEAGRILENRIPPTIQKFHAILNDLESDIVKTKSVILRDLNQIRARRKAQVAVSATVSASEPRGVAPPAPMVIDMESPTPDTRPAESAPVAPFPNMGLDLTTSPEMPPANMATPAMRAEEARKNSPRPPPVVQAGVAGAAGAAAGRPSGTPVRRDTKAAPVHAQLHTQAARSAPQPVRAPENMFTDMAFSVVPPATESPVPAGPSHSAAAAAATTTATQTQMQTQSVLKPADADVGLVGGGPGEMGVAGLANMDFGMPGHGTDMFDFGSAGVGNLETDYNLGGPGANKTNFEDMFFGGNSNQGGGEFDFGI